MVKRKPPIMPMLSLYFNILHSQRTAQVVAQLVEAGDFPLVSLEIFIDLILPAALRPWDRPSLERK
jgi:hypothetical protein